MKERPILFSAPMVRALLDGSKTQTRRLVKLPHNNPLGAWEPTTFGGPDGGRTRKGETIPLHTAIWHTRTGHCLSARCCVGDRLLVREAWRTAPGFDQTPPRDIEPGMPVRYEAEGAPRIALWGKLRSGMFMPPWASRITLEVTGVRVERLQDISEADAKAEGISEFMGGWWCKHDDAPQIAGMTPQEGFRHLWARMNGPGSWGANPWVWAVEFKRVKP